MLVVTARNGVGVPATSFAPDVRRQRRRRHSGSNPVGAIVFRVNVSRPYCRRVLGDADADVVY
jgi:hypothetical protein